MPVPIYYIDEFCKLDLPAEAKLEFNNYTIEKHGELALKLNVEDLIANLAKLKTKDASWTTNYIDYMKCLVERKKELELKNKEIISSLQK
jgi:hypothetical protein